MKIGQLTTNAVRENLKNEIISKLMACEDENYYFFDDEELILCSGHRFPCNKVELGANNSVIFDISIANVQDIEVTCADVMVESLEKILAAIKVNRHSVTIYAVEEDNKMGETNLIIYDKEIGETQPNEQISVLKEVIGVDWKPQCDNEYRAYPDSSNTSRMFIAVFS